MNPAYRKTLKLRTPVIVQPEWNRCQKLRAKEKNLLEEGWKLMNKEGKAWEEGWKIREKWMKSYKKAITRELGSEYIKRIDWDTGEVK